MPVAPLGRRPCSRVSRLPADAAAATSRASAASTKPSRRNRVRRAGVRSATTSWLSTPAVFRFRLNHTPVRLLLRGCFGFLQLERGADENRQPGGLFDLRRVLRPRENPGRFREITVASGLVEHLGDELQRTTAILRAVGSSTILEELKRLLEWRQQRRRRRFGLGRRCWCTPWPGHVDKRDPGGCKKQTASDEERKQEYRRRTVGHGRHPQHVCPPWGRKLGAPREARGGEA